MGLWNRIRDALGWSAKDFAIEGDRLVFRNVERAREIPLEPPLGPLEVTECGKCRGELREVVFTTAGSGQRDAWQTYALAVDGWVCTQCGWSAVPRRLAVDEAMAFEGKGREHLAVGQLDDAEFWFRRILASWQGYPIALANLGAVCNARAADAQSLEQRIAHRRAAAEFFARAASHEEHPVHGATVELARLEALDGREEEACRRLDALIAAEETEEEVRRTARELRDQLAEGRAFFMRGSELVSPYLRLAGRPDTELHAEAREHLREARKLLRESIARKPSFVAHWTLGKLEQVLGKKDAALVEFGKAIELEPDQVNGLREYVISLLTLDRAADAIEPARRAARLAPTDAGLRSNLALVLLLAGDLDEALETIEAALADDEQDAITNALARRIRDVRSGRLPRPKNFAQLEGR